jgi:hypothetical protein
VLRRGTSADKPTVASVASASGTSMLRPVLRHTDIKAHHVARGLAPHEIRVRVPLETLLRMLR